MIWPGFFVAIPDVTPVRQYSRRIVLAVINETWLPGENQPGNARSDETLDKCRPDPKAPAIVDPFPILFSAICFLSIVLLGSDRSVRQDTGLTSRKHRWRSIQ